MKLSSALRVGLARLGAPVPLSVGFEITHLCNLECGYCDRHTPLPAEMSHEQIVRVLGELHAMGMRHISLDGGEPLAHRFIDRVVDWLVERGDVRVYMNTNGILVPRKIDVVRRLQRVKISLDGPPAQHDAMRGPRAHERAIKGALAARDAGVSVEFTCVVGKHNAAHLDELLDQVERLGFGIVFQPARPSLFLGTSRDGSGFVAEAPLLQAAFAGLERRKRQGAPVGNRWSSLRHFRSYPDDAPTPCAAGWINATLDPEGNLYHCGQVSRDDRSNNVLTLGAREAFRRLSRAACAQCWCARVVEENYAWGGRLDRMIAPLTAPPSAPSPPAAAAPVRRKLPMVLRAAPGGLCQTARVAPPDSPLKHKPFSSLRNAPVAAGPPAHPPPAPPGARDPLGRVVVREEFDDAERTSLLRVIGVPREQLNSLGKQWRQALGSVVLIEGRDLLVVAGECERVAALLRDAGAGEVAIVRRQAPANLLQAGEPGGTQRAQIHRGLRVAIVLKADQESGALTEGVVRDILTSSPVHPRGIKVRLDSGQVGRVRRILGR